MVFIFHSKRRKKSPNDFLSSGVSNAHFVDVAFNIFGRMIFLCWLIYIFLLLLLLLSFRFTKCLYKHMYTQKRIRTTNVCVFWRRCSRSFFYDYLILFFSKFDILLCNSCSVFVVLLSVCSSEHYYIGNISCCNVKS